MIFIGKNGKYKTRNGYLAIVARRKWNLYGAVVLDNVYYIHTWSPFGLSLTGNQLFDIVERYGKT